jgi:hypothetical protein
VTRERAIEVISTLPETTREAIAVFVETCDEEGDWARDSDGESYWRSEAKATVKDIASQLRNMNRPNDSIFD